MFCCHRLFGLEIFSLNVVSFFFPKFLYGTFGKDIGVNSLSRFTEYDFIISPRSQGRAGRQAFLLEVPWSAYHSYDFGKSFLIIERVLGRWGRAPWNSRYHMLFQILPLCVLGPRMQCSGIQCSQPCSQWMSLHRPQMAQLMFMVVYHPAAFQTACEVGRRALGHGNTGSLFDCIKA